MISGTLKQIRRLIAPRSLRYQLLTRSLFILAALLLLIGGLQYVLMKNFLYQNKAESMEAQLRSLPRNILGEKQRKDDSPAGKEDGDKHDNHSPLDPGGPLLFFPDISLGSVSEDGTYTEYVEKTDIGSPILEPTEYDKIREQIEKRTIPGYKVVIDNEGVEQLVIFRPGGGPSADGTLLQMGTKTAPLREIAMSQFFIFIALSGLALAGGLALYLPILRRTLVPLNRMIDAVEQTDVDNLTKRVPDQLGQEEIDRLSASFNGMLKRLELSFRAEREAKEQMRRFIADASHELRTPLTSIHGFLEVLLRGAAENRDQLYSALNSMHGESRRMKKLVEDLLLLAKLDRTPELHLESARLDALLSEMEPHLRMLAGERTVQFDITAGVSAHIDTDKIKQVILNLFHNAVQHTDPQQGIIQISLTTIRQDVELKVRDNGPGIAEDHIDHIFERFYRSDSSRTRKYGGAGLGLSISQSIVTAHDGTIGVTSQLGKGSTFWVRLPLQPIGKKS